MSANKTYQNFVEKLGGTHADNFIGDEGMIFWDPNTGEMRLGDGTSQGGISLFKALASNFGVSADGGDTISSDFNVITYDGGNATSPFNIYDTVDGNVPNAPTLQFDSNAEYTFSNTIIVSAVKAGGTIGTNGQVLTSTGYNTVWKTPSGGGNVVDYGNYPTSGNQELISPASNKYHLLVDRSGGGRYTVSGSSWNNGDSFTVMTVFGTNPDNVVMFFDALQIYVAGSGTYQTKSCAIQPFSNTASETKTSVTFTWVNSTWHSDSTMTVTQII
jgi:hypothetical protein